ncbi:putative 15-hydroxyprostaglandin dehydrogenase [Xylariaceae sp. AK1471]|nr:putative 15-hydroxyprostaglandin dehydrogenase [Xylariaceae sp. AK1471]
MAEFEITDDSLTSLKGKVVIVTGGSSGIGLATVQLLLSLGSSVIGADVREPPEDAVSSSSTQFTFHKTDVSKWNELLGLFKKTMELHGRIDHVYANAGIAPKTDYVSMGIEFDDNGDLKEPTSLVLDINLKGVINTTTLGVHYIRQNANGGSVVVNASITGLIRFRNVDYGVAKHGTIGLMRGMHQALEVQNVPVRINAVASSWTGTGMVSEQLLTELGIYTQSPTVVARAAAALMTDESRRGHLIHVDHGVYKEIDEAVMLPAYNSLSHRDTTSEDESMGRITEAAKAILNAKSQGN